MLTLIQFSVLPLFFSNNVLQTEFCYNQLHPSETAKTITILDVQGVGIRDLGTHFFLAVVWVGVEVELTLNAAVKRSDTSFHFPFFSLILTMHRVTYSG